MTTVLYRKEDLEFCFSNTFDGRFLFPILDNMKEKIALHGWDDYDELQHCCRLIHEYSQMPGVVMDYHTLRRGEDVAGLALIAHGAIDPRIFAGSGIAISDPMEQVILLNYFHIAPDARGNGTFWLSDIIMPFYADMGYSSVYLKTSHAKAFPLYERFGAVIGHYSFLSDNGRHQRTGRIYRLPLHEKPFPKD